MSLTTLIQFIKKNNYRFFHIILITISIIALSSAYFIEYILHYTPCPLCIYERFPYLTLIKISLTALVIKKLNKYSLFFISLTLIGACTLSAYHSFVERGIVKPSSLCSSMIRIPKGLTIEHIKEMLYSQPITSCTKAALKLFGLSLTEYNFLLNFGLLIGLLVVCSYPKYE